MKDKWRAAAIIKFFYINQRFDIPLWRFVDGGDDIILSIDKKIPSADDLS